jgi:hypothetical protein
MLNKLFDSRLIIAQLSQGGLCISYMIDNKFNTKNIKLWSFYFVVSFYYYRKIYKNPKFDYVYFIGQKCFNYVAKHIKPINLILYHFYYILMMKSTYYAIATTEKSEKIYSGFCTLLYFSLSSLAHHIYINSIMNNNNTNNNDMIYTNI